MPDVSLLQPRALCAGGSPAVDPSRLHSLSSAQTRKLPCMSWPQSHTLMRPVHGPAGDMEIPGKVPGLRRLRASFGHPLLTSHSPLAPWS